MKRFFKTIAIFMVVILCVGSISTLFDIGADEPTGPGTTVQRPEENPDNNEEPDLPGEEPDEPEIPACTHVDADDNNVCDKCGESFSDAQDLFGGTVLASKTFDGETVTFENGVGKPNMGSFNPNAKYGIFTTENGYAKMSTNDSHAGTVSDSFFSIYANEEREAIMLNEFDYITIDFDLWTDSDYLSPIHFIFLENWQTNLSSTNHLMISKNAEGQYYLNINNSDDVSREISTSEKLHFTFVIKTKVQSFGYYDPKVLVYLNGEFITEQACSMSDFGQLEQLRILFVKQTVEAGKSVCLDNIQVSSFGTRSDGYSGALKAAYMDHSINLTECADSVLYNKTN